MAEAKAFKMIPHCTKDTIQYEMDELVRCKECKHLERLPWLDDKDGKAMVCRKHAFTSADQAVPSDRPCCTGACNRNIEPRTWNEQGDRDRRDTGSILLDRNNLCRAYNCDSNADTVRLGDRRPLST